MVVKGLIHNENDCELIPYLPNITRLSSWISGSWGKVKYILNKKIPNNFIILPMYLNDKGIQDEWQSQISGKVKKSENIFEAVQREIFEEIGLAYDIETIKRNYIDNEEFRGCNIHYFNINLNDCIIPGAGVFEDIIINCKKRSVLDDDKYTRISVFINFDKISEENISKIVTRHRIDCDDEAGKIILIMQKKILDHIINTLDFKNKPKIKKNKIINI